MRVLIRTDSGAGIGNGHVSRCLALAHEIQRNGGQAAFACQHRAGDSITHLEENGWPVFSLPASPARDDAYHTSAAISQFKAEWMILDHYGLDLKWERLLAEHQPAVKRLVLDDLERHHDCDFLLDPSLAVACSTCGYAGSQVSGERLLGPAFALFDGEYVAAGQNKLAHSGTMHNIVVFMSGGDDTNACGVAIQGLLDCGRNFERIDVILGKNHPAETAIRHQLKSIPGWYVHGMVPSLLPFYQRADLALGAGGVSAWERCMLGLPSLVTIIGENQRLNMQALNHIGAIRLLGEDGQVSAADYATQLQALDSNTLYKMAEKSATLVDGLGAQRVVRRMLQYSVAR